jgi:superfamily II DNA or RNA helicase
MSNAVNTHQRYFSSEQRETLFYAANGDCQACDIETTLSTGHADHIHPYTRGGPTIIENGQWLCEPCNRAKSDLVNGIRLPALRGWQSEFGRVFGTTSDREVLLYADPGAGKTVAALNAIAYCRWVYGVARFLFVVPGDHLVTQVSAAGNQWQAAGAYDVVFREAKSKGYDPSGATCLVVTTKLMQERPDDLRRFVNGGLVIPDEIHHLSDSNAFGEAAMHAFGGAYKILGMSGTPFRTDGQPIPFVKYVNGVPKVHYSITWAKTWSNDPFPWARFPNFHFIDGRWAGEDGIEYETVQELRDQAGLRRAYMTSYYDGLGFEQNAHSWEWLEKQRKNNPDAAELVVCSDRQQLEKCVESIEHQRGYRPVFVHNELRNPSGIIERFKTSREPTIVAVRMLLEGTDIPRLRCLNYQSNIETDLTLKQVSARVMRVEPNESSHDAHIVVPETDVIRGFAENIQDDLRPALIERESNELPELRSDELGRSTISVPDTLNIRGVDGAHVGTVSVGTTVDLGEQQALSEWLAVAAPDLQTAAPRLAAQGLSAPSVPGGATTVIKSVESVDAKEKRYRKQINSEVAMEAQRRKRMGKPRDFALLFDKLKKCAGVDKKELNQYELPELRCLRDVLPAREWRNV